MRSGQPDFFEPPDKGWKKFVLSCLNTPPVFVVSCGRRKSTRAAAAEDLYRSRRFQQAKKFVTSFGTDWYVLSGKHGLLEPAETLEPYDQSITAASLEAQASWAEGVLHRLQHETRKVVFLVPDRYKNALNPRNEPFPRNWEFPFENIDESHHTNLLRRGEALVRRSKDLSVLHHFLMSSPEVIKFKFKEFSTAALPEQGVYIFTDPKEPSDVGEIGRIVRIGTHAVSEGSRATLRVRLRNHFGLKTGEGSHRGSIFRLHVGEAIIRQRNMMREFPYWGSGQDANKEIKLSEQKLEREVSDYLSNLNVFVIPVADRASKNSKRAHLETQLIALCSQDLDVLEQASPAWLGNYSSKEIIRSSGLWNVRDVGVIYKPEKIGSVGWMVKALGGDNVS